jgi:hypothetical protein
VCRFFAFSNQFCHYACKLLLHVTKLLADTAPYNTTHKLRGSMYNLFVKLFYQEGFKNSLVVGMVWLCTIHSRCVDMWFVDQARSPWAFFCCGLMIVGFFAFGAYSLNPI